MIIILYIVIVDTIGSIDDLIEKYEEINTKLLSYGALIIKKLIGKKIIVKDYLSIKTGKLDANQNDENGLYPLFTCSENELRINDYSFDCEAIIISGNGSKLGYTNYYNGKFNAYQRTYVLTGNQYFYIWYFSIKNNIMNIVNQAKGSAVPYITKPMLENYEMYISNNEQLNTQINDIEKIVVNKISANKNKLQQLHQLKRLYLKKFFG